MSITFYNIAYMIYQLKGNVAQFAKNLSQSEKTSEKRSISSVRTKFRPWKFPDYLTVLTLFVGKQADFDLTFAQYRTTEDTPPQA